MQQSTYNRFNNRNNRNNYNNRNNRNNRNNSNHNSFRQERKKSNFIKNKEEFEIKEEEFPNLLSNTTTQSQKTDLNFQNISFENSHEVLQEENSQKVKDGWVKIKRENNQIKLIYGKSKIKKETEEEKQKKIRFQVYENLCNHWDNYRDEINELMGDCSPFLDYKEQINQMIEEDMRYAEELEELKANENMYSDDEEEYYDSNTDYYDFH